MVGIFLCVLKIAMETYGGGFSINFSRLASSPVGVATMDFDGDGWLDILTVGKSSSSFTGQVHWLNGTGGIHLLQ